MNVTFIEISLNQQVDWGKFKVYRNQVNNLNKRLKREPYQDEFSRCGNDVNKNWKILKHILPHKNKETDTLLVITNELIFDSKKIVDLMNEEFSKVSERLHKYNSDVNSMNILPMMANDFNFKEIKTHFVKNELLDIDCKQAVGLDGFHPKVLKKMEHIIYLNISSFFITAP